MSVKSGDAIRNGDVEFVQVFIVAAPGENLAVGGEDDAGDVVDGAGGAVVARDPLGGGKGDGAGFDGDVNLGVVELAGTIGEVGGDLDGGLAREWNLAATAVDFKILNGCLLSLQQAGDGEGEQGKRQDGGAGEHKSRFFS